MAALTTGTVATVCWRFSHFSSSDALWKERFETDFKVTAVRENQQWMKLFNQSLPRGKKSYLSVRGKRAVVAKRERKKKIKEKSKEKVSTVENESGGNAKERKKEKKRKGSVARRTMVDSDMEDEDYDSDGYEDIFDADICIGRVVDPSEARPESPRSKGRDRSNSNEGKIKGKLEGERSREKRKRRKSAEEVPTLSDSTPTRLKRKSKESHKSRETLPIERSESVLQYCQHHRLTRNDSARWKNRYRELMTDVLIQRVLLKHTNRVIWGKNSIKGRSAAASGAQPLKQRKSVHIVANNNQGNPDQITSGSGVSWTLERHASSSSTSSRDSWSEVSSAATISSPQLPRLPSSLSLSACVSLRSLPPAFSSSSFYCPYKFRVCSQRGKLHDAAQFGLVSHSSEEMSVYVLLYASHEDLPSPQVIPFLVTSTTGMHACPLSLVKIAGLTISRRGNP